MRSPLWARVADAEAVLRRFEREGLLRYVDVRMMESFGGNPAWYFDAIHMEEANSTRIMERVYGGSGCAVQ